MVRMNLTGAKKDNTPKTIEWKRNSGKVMLAHLRHFKYFDDRWDMYVVDPNSLVRWDEVKKEDSDIDGRKDGFLEPNIRNKNKHRARYGSG